MMLVSSPSHPRVGQLATGGAKPRFLRRRSTEQPRALRDAYEHGAHLHAHTPLIITSERSLTRSLAENKCKNQKLRQRGGGGVGNDTDNRSRYENAKGTRRRRTRIRGDLCKLGNGSLMVDVAE